MTLLIRNVRIVGEARASEERSDIFVQNDIISAIGSLGNKKADEVIDGQGTYLAPGFIDVNTDSDHYLTLFDNPAQEDFLKQGVTTIFGGMCGASLAPLLYGSLESIRKWGDIHCVNVGWQSLGELLDILSSRGLGVNFGTLIGHSTIRRALAGENFRNLTKNELKVFISTLERGMSEGGFGLSSGLSYVHARETSYAELKALGEVVQKRNGVYATHLRKSGEDLLNSLEETVKLRKETGVKTIISHFQPFMGTEELYDTALKNLEELSTDRAVYFDTYPFDASVVPLYTLLPLWAQETNLETMAANLKDAWKRKKIIKELPELSGDGLIVASAPGHEPLIGKNIETLKEMYGVSLGAEALLQLMRATDLRAIVFYKNIAANLLTQALAHPRSLIATNAASIKEGRQIGMLKPERATNTFPKFLDIVSLKRLMPLESAIQKITKTPAELLGIKGRGEIKEGNYADLVGFSWKEGGASATEIKFVVVNGTIAVQNGISKETLRGRILKHQS